MGANLENDREILDQPLHRIGFDVVSTFSTNIHWFAEIMKKLQKELGLLFVWD
jgi:hypothetical protein